MPLFMCGMGHAWGMGCPPYWQSRDLNWLAADVLFSCVFTSIKRIIVLVKTLLILFFQCEAFDLWQVVTINSPLLLTRPYNYSMCSVLVFSDVRPHVIQTLVRTLFKVLR